MKKEHINNKCHMMANYHHCMAKAMKYNRSAKRMLRALRSVRGDKYESMKQAYFRESGHAREYARLAKNFLGHASRA